MVPELSLEVIYYKQKTDFKLEFALCSVCSVRFLSTLTNERKEFTQALRRALSRSRAVVLVGSFRPQGAEYLPHLLAETVGLPEETVDVAHFGIQEPTAPFLPKGGLPLVTVEGRFGGGVIEKADQTLILLTDEIALRQEITRDLVCPYLAHFATHKVGKKPKNPVAAPKAETLSVPEKAEQPLVSPQAVETVEMQPSTKKSAKQEPAPVLEKAPEVKEDAKKMPVPAAESAVSAAVGLEKAEQIIHSALQTADSILAAVRSGEMPSGFTASMAEKAEPVAPVSQAVNSQPDSSLENSSKKDESQDLASAPLENEVLKQPAEETSATTPEKAIYADPELCFVPNDLPPVTADSVLPAEDILPHTVPEEMPGYAVLEQPDRVDSDLYSQFMKGEEPTPRRRKTLRAVISVILVIAVVLSAYFGYEFVYQPMHCNSVYSNVQEMYGQPWSALPENMLVKFGRLYSVNSDLAGWISLPECEINFPVVSTVTSSANYYNTHLFEGSVSNYGTPYINQSVDNESFYRNLIIYGKSFEDGQMFSKLSRYLEIEVYRKAPVISFDTVYLENKWKIFAVFETDTADFQTYCQSVFFDDSAFLQYIEKVRAASVLETGIEVTAQDELLTLTTSLNGKSVVVIGRKVREGESPLVDVTESYLRDYEQTASKAVEAVASATLTEVSSTSSVTVADSSVDKAMTDNASSRYEQQAPVSSQVTVKPNAAVKPSSSSELSSSVAQSSGKNSSVSSSGSAATSSKVSSAVSSGTQTAVTLPTITVTNQSTGKKVTGNAADILAQVIEAEMGSGYHLEALKAQTVAAYSWLICNGALTGGAPYVPMKTAGARAKQAVQEVAGQVAVYGGNIAQTYYYAISAGYTANCQDVWVASLPYLVSVDSSVDKNIAGYQTVRSYKASDVAKWVQETTGVNLTAISDKNTWFRCTYDQHGLYVKNVEIGGKLNKKGPYLREQIFTSVRVGSANVLRSSAYKISYNDAEDKFVFTVRGYGHGIGMSQVGANAYAKSGWDYEKILKHYYTGISLGMYVQ